jgi:hypothetical protein
VRRPGRQPVFHSTKPGGEFFRFQGQRLTPVVCEFVIAARASVDCFFTRSAHKPVPFQTLERGVERRDPQRNRGRRELLDV